MSPAECTAGISATKATATAGAPTATSFLRTKVITVSHAMVVASLERASLRLPGRPLEELFERKILEKTVWSPYEEEEVGENPCDSDRSEGG